MPTTKKPQGRSITVKGITVDVPEEALDDFELLDDLARIQTDARQSALLPAILRRIVGDEGFRIVMDGLRDKGGRVSVQAGVDWIKELFEALNPNS